MNLLKLVPDLPKNTQEKKNKLNMSSHLEEDIFYSLQSEEDNFCNLQNRFREGGGKESSINVIRFSGC